MITDYKVVCRSSIEDLQEDIERFLNGGWELYRGPFSHNNCLCQAMVKRDRPHPIRWV